MKLRVFVAALIVPFPAMALQCGIPSDCKEIIYASYEIGAHDTALNQVKMACKRADGSVSAFVANVVSVSGFFGMNRVTAGGTRVDFVPSKNSGMTCK